MSYTDSPARILAASALAMTQLDSDVVVETAIGGIPAGTVYPAGTSTSKIVTDLLSSPPSNVDIYVGATTNIPTSATESGMVLKQVLNTTLLNTETGYELNIKAGLFPPAVSEPTAQYPVIALPDDYAMVHWYPSILSAEMPHTMVHDTTNQYNVYYLNDKSIDSDIGGCDYRIFVQRSQS